MLNAGLICTIPALIPDRGSSSRGNRRRSSSRHRREARQRWNGLLDEIKIVHENFRRELSLGSHSTPDQGREARVTRYKEERKRNLHRGELGTHEQKDTCRGHLSDSTDSEGDDSRTRASHDKLSYTEYKRRRRLRDVNRNLSKSTCFNLQTFQFYEHKCEFNY